MQVIDRREMVVREGEAIQMLDLNGWRLLPQARGLLRLTGMTLEFRPNGKGFLGLWGGRSIDIALADIKDIQASVVMLGVRWWMFILPFILLSWAILAPMSRVMSPQGVVVVTFDGRRHRFITAQRGQPETHPQAWLAAIDAQRAKSMTAPTVSEVVTRPSGTSPPRIQPASGVKATAEKLRELTQLRDEGILTDDEYEAKRKRLADTL